MTWGRTAAAGAMAAAVSLGAAGCSDTKDYVMPAESMEPGITAGETIEASVVEDYEPGRGDVIVFEDPGGWLVAGGDDGKLVKRVIGREGDVIECCDDDGWLLINGEPLDESKYLPQHHGRCAAELFSSGSQWGRDLAGRCDWKLGPVPPDTMFVLGDNRPASADSRFHICAPEDTTCDDSPWVDTGLVIGVVEE